MITKPQLIQYLLFLIQKESTAWFITDYKVKDRYLEISTHELITDPTRNIDFHWNKSEIVDVEKLDEFKIWNRDTTIEDILIDEPQLFSNDDNIKLKLLRIQSHFDKNKTKIISKESAIKEYSNRLKVGDKITYKNMPGIIIYQHKGDELKFTIKMGNKYLKYINANELVRKIKNDYSNIDIPNQIKELKTTDLLFLLKESRITGYRSERFRSLLNINYNSDTLRAELSTREHIKNKR